MSKRFITPPEIHDLKRAGYICLQIQPLRWRIRGELGFMDVWLHAKKVCRNPQQFLQYERHPHLEPYSDLMELVRNELKPWPDERTLEEKDAGLAWRSMLDEVVGRLYPHTPLAA